MPPLESPPTTPYLAAADLLAGSQVVHDVEIPPEVLQPGTRGVGGRVQLRPLNLATMTLIARAAREDSSLVPLLTIKEAVVEPTLTLDQVRQMHVGLVHFLVGRINVISGLSEDGSAIASALNSSLGHTHLMLAKHFGWTPEQVSQLTPGQVAVYLAGIEKLLALEAAEGRATP
ncbi:MAG: hypothetical protein ACHWZW_20855 [Spirulina sp.]